MTLLDYAAKAESYLKTLCSVKPNRRTGSSGNRAATDFFARTIRAHGYVVDDTTFDCLDYVRGESLLAHEDTAYEVHISPYSLGCDVEAELVTVSTMQELEGTNCEGKILLMTGELCSEPLMPKNFTFYNPEHHRRLVALLESLRPAAIITATESKPELVGALDPYPLIVDGDFDIPNVYCRDAVGDELAGLRGEVFHLKIDARRLSSTATNVIARSNQGARERIVATAHIDAYEDTPGASDNASGTVVLLLLAEMLSEYRGDKCIEIAALNGEDHYSAGGQMDYLNRYGSQFCRIALAINVDDVGYKRGRSSYSFYECAPQLEERVEDGLQSFDGLARGEQWYNGDHMIFVQSGVPSMALTSECIDELMRTVTHTSRDTPDIIDCHKLVEVADALNAMVRSL